jgi:hypothetical protein
MILAIWAAVVIWKNTWRKGPIGLYFAGFIGGMVFLVALIVMTSLHNPYRFVNLNFNMILTIPLVGFLLYQKRKLGKMKTARFVIFLIILAIIASTLSIYQDPIQSHPNGITPISEASGGNWYINTKDTSVITSVLAIQPARFADLTLGHVYELNHWRYYIYNETASHFTSIMSSNETGNRTYVIISTYDRVAYTQVWQNTNRFVDEDFQALSLSNKVDKNFDNGGFSCYFRA